MHARSCRKINLFNISSFSQLRELVLVLLNRYRKIASIFLRDSPDTGGFGEMSTFWRYFDVKNYQM